MDFPLEIKGIINQAMSFRKFRWLVAFFTSFLQSNHTLVWESQMLSVSGESIKPFIYNMISYCVPFVPKAVIIKLILMPKQV